MDLTESIAPKSDQINADDLMAGPRTFTVEGVNAGSAEQPVNIHLVELPGRPYRPSKSMRRVLVAGWGKEAAAYAGRRLTLFRNPDITFGRDKVGGIEISHMSHLDKPLSVPLTVTRGRKKSFNVAPLVEAAPSNEIPQQVRDTVESITDPGMLADYLAHITTQGAPAHIIEWVSAQNKEA